MVVTAVESGLDPSADLSVADAQPMLLPTGHAPELPIGEAPHDENGSFRPRGGRAQPILGGRLGHHCSVARIV
jgi:hypothetical protein